jgi:hypothetical protein
MCSLVLYKTAKILTVSIDSIHHETVAYGSFRSR